MSFFQRLQIETQAERLALQSIPFIQRGVAGTVTRQDYLDFLAQAYHHVRHTVPLMMACGARLADHPSWLQRAMGEYIEEEIGHEEWILNDIAASGGDAEAVRHSRPLPATELMLAYAYDTINRVNPLGLFGMVFVLEGTSVALATQAADNIRRQLGLPKSAFSYLNSHGALDVSHLGFFEGLINRIEDRRDQDQIIHSARMFFRLYGDIFRSIDSHNREELTHVAA